MNRHINVAGILRQVGNVKIALSENIVFFLHPHVDDPQSLVVDGKLCLRDDKKVAFV